MSESARIAKLEREVASLKRRLAERDQDSRVETHPLHNFGLPTLRHAGELRPLRDRVKVFNG